MRSIAFINEKGGTAKTTLAVNLAAWLAKEQGRRVLLCDLDTQGHAGKSLGLDVRGMSPTILDLLLDSHVTLSSVLRPTAIPGLDVLPSNKSPGRLPRKSRHQPRQSPPPGQPPARSAGLRLHPLRRPAVDGALTLNVMVAAEEIVIPVALTYFALDGCAEILETVNRVREEQAHPSLRISLVVPTFYRKTTLADEILSKLKERFPSEIARTVLSYSVRIDEAQSHAQTIWEYDPGSRGAQMLAEIGRELVAKGATANARAAV